MYSYPPLVDGSEQPVESWVHCVRASSILQDAFDLLRLKRELDASGDLEAAAADPRVVGRVGISSPEVVDRALVAARRDQREWAATPLKERIAFGIAVHEQIRARAEDFVDVLVAEGHPRRLAAWEVTGVVHGTSPETFEAQAHFMGWERAEGGRRISLVRKPDGVVCLAPPRNAAASCSVLGLLSVVAGNALVMKAPRSTPLGVSWVWHELIRPLMAEWEVPAGVLAIVCGEPEAVLAQWLDSSDVDDIMYFGSSERGLQLEQRAVARGKKPVLELAGNDGVLVWCDADLELAARAVAECFYGSSQICMVPKYAVVHPGVAGRFLELLMSEAEAVRPGMPEHEETLLSPVLKTDDYFAVLAQALEAGAELLCGGERMDQNGEIRADGIFLQPTVLRVNGLEAAKGIRAAREETFFPLLPIVVPDPSESLLADCLDFMESNAYGLRNSVWSASEEVVDQFCLMGNGGLLKVNDSHIGFVPGLPTHGGTGITGGSFGECNLPMLRTTHLQGISVATDIRPASHVFHSAVLPGDA